MDLVAWESKTRRETVEASRETKFQSPSKQLSCSCLWFYSHVFQTLLASLGITANTLGTIENGCGNFCLLV